MQSNELVQKLEETWGPGKEKVHTFFSPGRVNLIGEHTDYNNGYVFPCPLQYGTYMAVRKNDNKEIRFATLNFEGKTSISVDDISKKADQKWAWYPQGVLVQMLEFGYKPEGMDLLFYGDIPSGAGLSSSASIEMATAYGINELFQLKIELVDLVKLSQRAENQFVGVNCGIMDQFAVGTGKKDHALFLNCETLEYELVPLDLKDHILIISNTNKSRGLSDSKYNQRRSECDKAVEYISKKKPIEHLSQIDLNEFNELKDAISDPTVLKRARHVVSENQRVLEAVDTLKAGELSVFGALMNQSHDSLRDDYEVTGMELDTLVEEARKVDGVLGSRMTGAGFGGCTVSLVHKDAEQDFMVNVGAGYYKVTGIRAGFYTATVGEGVRKI